LKSDQVSAFEDFTDSNQTRLIVIRYLTAFNSWLLVCLSAATADFAVASIRRWWEFYGRERYKGASAY
jgi:hypothetical protein